MDKAINEIMDWFDFGRVHRAMVALDWKWGLGKDKMAVPEEGEIRTAARALLNRVAGNPSPDWYTSTGGFTARKTHGTDLQLFFAVSEWDSSMAVPD